MTVEVRIQNIHLPPKAHIRIALTKIYGIGLSTAESICSVSNIPGDTKVLNLLEEQVETLREEVRKHKTEGDLRREVAMNIKRKKDIRCYEGDRHKRNLPLRKRTKTNARTRKGPRRSQQAAKK